MSSPNRNLTKHSIWEVQEVSALTKSAHRFKMWNHLIWNFDIDTAFSADLREQIPFNRFNFPRENTEQLCTKFVGSTMKVVERKESARGDTTKLLMELQDGHLIETVIMRHRNYSTVCVSSQIGCKMGCKFCATGTMGIIGDLTTGEILEQVAYANQVSRIRNVVFMGMGEPLNNYENVRDALEFLIDPKLFSLSPKHVTVSTVGVIKYMKRLEEDIPTVNLALSLHAPNQEVRLKIVPSASGNPFDKLMAEVDRRIFGDQAKRKISNRLPGQKEKKLSKLNARNASLMIEYILIADVNDSFVCAHELGALLTSRREHLLLNLIPYNPTDVNDEYQAPSEEQILGFHAILISDDYRIHTRTRQEKGQDIDGACGQLVVAKDTKAKTRDIEDMYTNEPGRHVSTKEGKNKKKEKKMGGSKSISEGVQNWWKNVTIGKTVTVLSVVFFLVATLKRKSVSA